MTFFNSTDINLMITAAVILIALAVICRFGRQDSTVIIQNPDYLDDDDIDEGSSIQEMIANRTKMVGHCVDVILNSLEVGTWAESEGIDSKDMLVTNSFMIKDVIFVSAVVVPMNLKVTCGLNYEKQKLYVRIEQPLRRGYIQVEDNFKLQAGIISVAQSEKLVAKYLKQLNKRVEAIPVDQIDEANTEDNEDNEE